MPLANLLLDAVFLRLKSQILGIIAVTCLHGMRSYRYTYSRTATLSLIVRSFINSHQQHHSSFGIIHHRSSSFICKYSSPPCFDLHPPAFLSGHTVVYLFELIADCGYAVVFC